MKPIILRSLLALIMASGAAFASPATAQTSTPERKWHFEMDLRYQHMFYYTSRTTYSAYNISPDGQLTSPHKLTVNSHSIIGDDMFPNGYGGNSLLLMETYTLSPRWTVGLGVGLSIYKQNDTNTLPIFALGRWHPWMQHSHAYVYAEAGLLGCPTANVGYGFSVKAGKKRRLDFKVGYDMQLLRHKYTGADLPFFGGSTDKYTNHEMLHCLQASVGVVF